MTDEPKFCKDCKHFERMAFPPMCTQPPERELIYGRTTPAWAESMRSEDGACKPEGLLWEEKPAPEVVVPAALVQLQEDADAEMRYVASSPTPGAWVEQHIFPQLRWWEFWN